MFDKLTSVSPPQKLDPLIKNQRSEKLENRDSKSSKSDFEDNLKEQIKQQDKKLLLKAEKNKAERSEESQKFKTDVSQSRPGENKKKVASAEVPDDEVDLDLEKEEGEELVRYFDPTMISMNMVSIESEVEIPDVTENLAMIDKSNTELIPQAEQLSRRPELNVQPELSAIQVELQDGSEEATVDIAKMQPVVEEVIPVSQPVAEAKPSVRGDAATNDFQLKVMEALKKEQAITPELKLDDLKEKLVTAQSEVKLGHDSSDHQAKADSDATKQDLPSDSKSLGEDVFKSETHKTDLQNESRGEFRTQLSTVTTDFVKGSENVVNTDSTKESGLNELLNQANYLVTKGGGEVTVKLNGADGMGDVHLKVMMDNGKMNIELNTQDLSVKKLIEESLSDLKSSLASRQISLEHVKINSVNATNTENNSQSSQGQSNSSGSESHQSKTFDQLQQQFERSKQQQNQQKQNSFSRSLLNEDRPVLIPIASIQKSAARQYYGLNKAQGLNAVA